MKTLILLRHAKSSWGQPGLSDVERPLNSRGKEACGRMAGPIWEAGCRFQDVFCSVATRAQMTIEGITGALGEASIRWEVDSELYTFSSSQLLDWVRRLDDALEDVVAVGHNPAMTDFCNSVGNGFIHNMPTCGYAQIRFAKDSWREIGPGAGKLVAFLTPKTLD